MPYVPPMMPAYDPPTNKRTISETVSPEALKMLNDEFEAPPPKPPVPEPTADELRPKKEPRRRTLLPSISLRDHTFNPDDVAKKLL